MSLMPQKFIGIKTCLQAKRPSKLLNDLKPKKIHTFEAEKSQRKQWKVEEKGVQRNIYDDYCKKTSKGYLDIAHPKVSH